MSEPSPQPANPSVAHVEIKAALLLGFMLLLIVGSALYVLYARGAFEATQKLVLVAEDSEGVVVGMDLTFAGFPIGRVRSVELARDGKARINIDVPRKDAHWLRMSSVFTLTRGLVGGVALRAYSGILDDPPMPDGAERMVLAGDTAAEIPRLVSAAKDLLDNLGRITRKDGELEASLANVQKLTERLTALTTKVDTMAAKADSQVFGGKDGKGGLVGDTRQTVQQLNAMLTETRDSLKRVDAILVEAQAIAGNARAASADLSLLRAQVEGSLRKVDGLVNEINRKWPFARDAEIKLP